MPILTEYTDKQVEILVNFRALESTFYSTAPTTLSQAKDSDYTSTRNGIEVENLKVKDGVINQFLFLLVKEYAGEPEDFEAFLKWHLDSVYKVVCAVSAKEKIKKLLDEARGLAGYYDLYAFYQDNR